MGAYKMEHDDAPDGDGRAWERGRRMAGVEGMSEHAFVGFDLISRPVDNKTSNGQRKTSRISLALGWPRRRARGACHS